MQEPLKSRIFVGQRDEHSMEEKTLIRAIREKPQVASSKKEKR